MAKNGADGARKAAAAESRSLARELRNRMALAEKAAAERAAQQEATAKAERARIEGLCANAKAKLEAVGWTNVKVDHRAFFTISGDNAQGENHSTANADLDAALAHMLEVGKPSVRVRRPEPVVVPPTPKPLAMPTMSPKLQALILPDEDFDIAHGRLLAELLPENDALTNRRLNRAATPEDIARHDEIAAILAELQRLGAERGLTKGT